ncbi:helix-turn-helix domain-containing protein [Paraburkholderia heleia]|uniref:helix-turn-helix domain-containing protein n=1 Tax=Paraburkholderia heleia TaxID=634127 RepID=UPI002AB72E6F|nr:helix-turn-helix transcriptional regulator [Paraburkholderia heleia]
MIGQKFATSYSFAHISGMEPETIATRLLSLVRAKRSYHETRWQSQLSRETGVPQSTISRLMAGSTPEMSNIAALAVHFDVTCEWLITGRGPKHIAEMYRAPKASDSELPPPQSSASARSAMQAVIDADQAGVDGTLLEAAAKLIRGLAPPGNPIRIPVETNHFAGTPVKHKKTKA